LSNQSFLEQGVATIDLFSTTTPGTITVTASSTGLEPGAINVYTGGWIYLTSSSNKVPVNETSEITVTTKDVNGVPIKCSNRTISLLLEESYNSTTGSGDLSSNSVSFSGTSSETVTFTASGVGKVKITANDSTPIILTPEPENELILTVIPELNPDHIKVNADPSNIPIKIGGDTPYTTITAQVEDKYYTTITSYPALTTLITFTTDKGHFTTDPLVKVIDTSDTLYVDYENGVAEVKLYSSDLPETANISVTSNYYGKIISGNTRVGFYYEADHIDLIANPQSILTGGGSEGTCTIIATIKDGNTVVTGYEGLVTFTIVEGYPSGVKFTTINQSSITINADDGVAEMLLASTNWVGTAKIEVSAVLEGPPYTLKADILIPVVANKNLEVFLLYSDDSNNYMNYYNPDGSDGDSWVPNPVIYGKFCVDSDNNLYILDIDGSCIQKKSSRGELLLGSDEIAEIYKYDITGSYTINIGPNGYIYFTQNTVTEGSPAYFINKINPNTLVIEDTLNLTPDKLYYGFAVDSDGSIYIHNYSDQTIEQWNFIEGPTEFSIDLSYNYNNSELAIAGECIGGVGVEDIDNVRKAFILPKNFSSAETEFTSLNGNLIPFYISSIDGDFLFGGLNNSNEVVFGRYGTDDSLKWSHIITKENEIPFLDCIIGAYPF